MGYCTTFHLVADDDIAGAVSDKIEEVSGYRLDNGTLYDAKWYHCDDDMRDISRLFPDRLISIYANGEENDDMWRAHFKNGKMQMCHARIEFDQYDPEKLE